MGRTDWLGALRNQACFGTSRRRRLIRVQHIEVLERRAAPSDAFGFITGSAALGGSLIAGDDLQADPSKHLDAPQAGRAGGVSPPSNDARLPISSPPEAPPSFDASISEPAPLTPPRTAFASPLTSDLLDDLLVPTQSPITANPAPAAAPAAQPPLVDSAPKGGGGGAPGHDSAGGGGGGGGGTPIVPFRQLAASSAPLAASDGGQASFETESAASGGDTHMVQLENSNAPPEVASEYQLDGASFVVSRMGGLDNELTVSFTLGGSATLGSDYTITSTTAVTIPAGELTGTVTLTPIDDTLVEEYESVTLTFAPSGPGYTLYDAYGNQAQGPIEIVTYLQDESGGSDVGTGAPLSPVVDLNIYDS